MVLHAPCFPRLQIASTWEGIRACEMLQDEGIDCNMTLLFSFAQVGAFSLPVLLAVAGCCAATAAAALMPTAAAGWPAAGPVISWVGGACRRGHCFSTMPHPCWCRRARARTPAPP